MVKTAFVSAVLVTLLPQVASSDGVEPSVKRLSLPPISSIEIRENAARSPAARDSSERCSEFVLRKTDVMSFLTEASEVSQHDYLHLLDWSACYASGKVTFDGGLTGTWGIHRLRGGSLKLNDGRTLYLYCPKCKAKAFPNVGGSLK